MLISFSVYITQCCTKHFQMQYERVLPYNMQISMKNNTFTSPVITRDSEPRHLSEHEVRTQSEIGISRFFHF